jgi:hypothetical protein
MHSRAIQDGWADVAIADPKKYTGKLDRFSLIAIANPMPVDSNRRQVIVIGEQSPRRDTGDPGDIFAGNDHRTLDMIFTAILYATDTRVLYVIDTTSIPDVHRYLRNPETPNRIRSMALNYAVEASIDPRDSYFALEQERAVTWRDKLMMGAIQWPLPNVCLAYRPETIKAAESGLPILKDIPAQYRAVILSMGERWAFDLQRHVWGNELVRDERDARNYNGSDEIVMRDHPVRIIDWSVMYGRDKPSMRAMLTQCVNAGLPAYVARWENSNEPMQWPAEFRVRSYPPEWERESRTPADYPIPQVKTEPDGSIDASKPGNAFRVMSFPQGLEPEIRNGSLVELTDETMDIVPEPSDDEINDQDRL